MQFAIVAVFVSALVVVDTVGDIRGLLDLSHETACTDGMDTTSGDKEHVALVDIVTGQGIGDGVVFYHLRILFRGNLLIQTVVDKT